MGGPPTSDFFFDSAGTDSQEFIEVVRHVPIAWALVEDLEIGLDEGHSAAEQECDLSDLHLLLG